MSIEKPKKLSEGILANLICFSLLEFWVFAPSLLLYWPMRASHETTRPSCAFHSKRKFLVQYNQEYVSERTHATVRKANWIPQTHRSLSPVQFWFSVAGSVWSVSGDFFFAIVECIGCSTMSWAGPGQKRCKAKQNKKAYNTSVTNVQTSCGLEMKLVQKLAQSINLQ